MLGQRKPVPHRLLTLAMMLTCWEHRTPAATNVFNAYLFPTPTPQRTLATPPCGHLLLGREFDRDANGYVSFDELLLGLRGQLNERRLDMVKRCFKVLDKTGDGAVTLADLERRYDATRHPDVVAGTKTQRMVGGPGCRVRNALGMFKWAGRWGRKRFEEQGQGRMSGVDGSLAGSARYRGWRRDCFVRKVLSLADRSAGAAGVPGHLRVGRRRRHGRRPGHTGGVRQLLRVSGWPRVAKWP